MGRRGPKPKPAAQRLREGGTKGRGKFSHRPLPDPTLITVGGRDVSAEPPEDLASEAAEVWSKIVPWLTEKGVLDRVDAPALRIFCVLYGRAVQAAAVLDAEVDEEADAELAERLADTHAIVRAQKVLISRQLSAGVDVSPAKISAVQNLEATVAKLEAHRQTRRRVGNLAALGSTGQLVAHPLRDVERQASAAVLAFCSRFGLTPADRAAIGLDLLEGHRRRLDVDEILGRPR